MKRYKYILRIIRNWIGWWSIKKCRVCKKKFLARDYNWYYDRNKSMRVVSDYCSNKCQKKFSRDLKKLIAYNDGTEFEQKRIIKIIKKNLKNNKTLIEKIKV